MLTSPVNPEQSLTTHELTLEPIVPAHASLLFEPLQATELYTFIPHEPPTSIATLEARYERWSKRQSADGTERWLNYAVFHRIEERHVGTVQATLTASDKTWIAYEVFPRWWRRGYARMACSALISHLFTAYEIPTVSALVDTRNEASWRLLESLKFVRIATIEDADHFKGSPSHEYEYALPRSSWSDLTPAK